jgi:hypothetical protein
MKPSQEHSDADFYEIALNEIQSGKVNRGLMIKATAKTGGDKKKAQGLYLDWRAKLLEEEAIILAKKIEEKRKAKETDQKAKEAAIKALVVKGAINKEVAQKNKERAREAKEIEKMERTSGLRLLLAVLYALVCVIIITFSIAYLFSTEWFADFYKLLFG